MVESVCVPEAAFVPDQPPLAVQLWATGLVDQVRTGVRLPVAEVLLAFSVTTPAVCALAAPAPKRNRTNKEAIVWMRMKNDLHESVKRTWRQIGIAACVSQTRGQILRRENSQNSGAFTRHRRRALRVLVLPNLQMRLRITRNPELTSTTA